MKDDDLDAAVAAFLTKNKHKRPALDLPQQQPPQRKPPRISRRPTR